MNGAAGRRRRPGRGRWWSIRPGAWWTRSSRRPTQRAPGAAPRLAHVAEDEALARLDSLDLDVPARPPATVAEPPEEEALELDDRPRAGAADLRKKLLSRGLRNLGSMPVPPPAGME